MGSIILAVMLMLNIITCTNISDSDAQRLYQDNSNEIESALQMFEDTDIE